MLHYKWTDKKNQRAVCFSPSKRALLLECQTNKTMIKISKFNCAKTMTLHQQDDFHHQYPWSGVRIPVPQKNPADIMKEMDFVNMCTKFLQIGEVEITNIKKMRIAKRLVTDGMVHINLTQ